MSDDDRTRRRLGDETKGRIADLASGWDTSTPEPAPAPKPVTPQKSAPVAMPPAKSAPVAIPPAKSAPVAMPPAKSAPASIKTPTPKPARGDETNARIADLASGWTVDGADTPEDSPAIPAAPMPRKKQKTLPPPPPGSQERRALEAAIMDANTGAVPKSEPVKLGPPASGPVRAKQPTAPPPLPPAARSGAHAKPPSTTKSGPTETGTVNVSGVIGGMTPAPMLVDPRDRGLPGVGKAVFSEPPGTERRAIDTLPLRADPTGPPPTMPAATPPRPPPIAKASPPPITTLAPDESGEATEVDPNAHLTVPIGEFDHGGTNIEQDKLRIAYEQSTIKRDATHALLGIPEQPLTVVRAPSMEILLGESAAQITRGDPTNIDPQTAKFERGDPTLGPDATSIDPPGAFAAAGGGKLRTQAALRRKRGIGGDVRYVATAVLGVRRARRELAELEHQQAVRQKSRARHLLTLGRSAVSAEGYDHPALSKARELLGVVEDERAQHTATVAAADSELMRVRNDRAEKAKAYAENIAAVDADLADITKKLEPIEKEVTSSARKAADLHEALRRIDAQIATTEASKVNVKSQKLDPAQIQADLATLKADRMAVERDEPRIAADLDALNPRLAALESRRTEARKRRIELEDEEKKDQGRAQELLAAIGAKRIVVDRAAADAEAMRDKILLELGERIYVDRPTSMQFELTPIDAIDVELGSTDRRLMELREIIGSVDKAKLARGIAVIILVLAAIGTFTYWLLSVLG